MPTKKTKKRKTPSGRSTDVTPYVAERIRKLAPEHGWDAEHVERVVAGEGEKKPTKKS